MPWWGWLIAGCVCFAGLVVVTVVTVVARTMRSIDGADLDPNWTKRPDGWRR